MTRPPIPEPDPPADVDIRRATPADRLDVLRVLDAALLRTDPDALDERIDADDVLVAVVERGGDRTAAGDIREDTVVGAAVLDDSPPSRTGRNTTHLDAVAVRRERRGRGIGTALVAAALEAAATAGYDALTASFAADLEAFYTPLGFQLPNDDGDGAVDDSDVGADSGRTGCAAEDRVFGVRPLTECSASGR